MSAEEWPSMAESDQQRFAEARHQVHSLLQWLARIEKSYGPAAGSTADVTLRWCDARKAITTRRLGKDLQLELRLPEMVLQFWEGGRAANHALSAEEHSPAHVEAWLLIELLHRGIDRKRFTKELPYDVSGLMSGDGVEFSPELYQNELITLTQCLSAAAAAILQASETASQDPDEEIVLRPDDFSLEATFDSRRVLGFKASGAKMGEPLFYIRTSDEGGRTDVCNEIILPASRLPSSGGCERLRMFFQSH